jgi:uncharacterized protein (DUF885 family)
VNECAVNTQLEQLAEKYWQFSCREQPFTAILAGEKTADAILFRESVADYDRRCQGARSLLSELSEIPSAALTAQDLASHRLLQRELETIISLHAVKAHLRPSLYPAGPDFNLIYFANASQANTVRAAERYVQRLATVSSFIQDLRDALTDGVAQGFRYPGFVLTRAADAVRNNLTERAEDSALFSPFRRSSALQNAAVKKFGQQALELIGQEIQPALQAYANFLSTTLMQTSRDSIACSEGFQGAEYYDLLVRHYTSLDLGPEQVHQLGLAEVARLQADIEQVAAVAGFAGRVDQYRHYLVTDPSFQAGNAQVMLEQMQALCKTIDRQIPAYFGRLPRITYGVQSIPPALSESMPPAYAQPSPADYSSPGIFWLTSLPEKCPVYMYPCLALHEAWPGHLMQIALMQEQYHLPKFRRNGALKYTACIEGWAMYCEQLGIPMGLYPGPHENFGRLNMEMWRAVRMVLDTGIHFYDWTRQQAIDYMAARVSVPMAMITAEVDRYIALPGQALAYQPGNLKIRELRERCEQVLGDEFDIRRFHDAMIAAGPVTLGVLDDLMTDWLDTQRKKHDQHAA